MPSRRLQVGAYSANPARSRASPGSAARSRVCAAGLDMIKQQGNGDQVDQVDQANQELPDNVHPERDSGKLERFGINPQDVLSKLGGGIAGI
jgi:hypothetical protein